MFLVFIIAMLVLCFVYLDMVFFGCIKQLVGELVLSRNWNFYIFFCGFDCFGIIVWWAQLSFYTLLHTLLKWIVLEQLASELVSSRVCFFAYLLVYLIVVGLFLWFFFFYAYLFEIDCENELSGDLV